MHITWDLFDTLCDSSACLRSVIGYTCTPIQFTHSRWLFDRRIIFSRNVFWGATRPRLELGMLSPSSLSSSLSSPRSSSAAGRGQLLAYRCAPPLARLQRRTLSGVRRCTTRHPVCPALSRGSHLAHYSVSFERLVTRRPLFIQSPERTVATSVGHRTPASFTRIRLVNI